MSTEAFLIIFIAFWAIITLVPLCFRRFKVPSVIVLLVMGMVIGPNGLGVLNFLAKYLNFLGVDPEVVRSHSLTLINSLGSLGLVFLMTLAGLEADFKLIKSVRKPTIWLSILTFIMPAVAGFLVYFNFVPMDLPGQLLYASLFASHSVGIVFPVIRELKLAKTRFGAAVLISTVITDIGSIVLLAVSVQLKRMQMGTGGTGAVKSLSVFDYINPAVFGNWFVPAFLLIALLYMILACYGANRIGHFARKYLAHDEDALVTFFLFLILLSVLVGEFLGINLVVGAFIAGLGLSKVVKEMGNSALFCKLEGIGYSLLIPFLFISIGMKTDFRLIFNSADNLAIILYTIVCLVGSKVLSGFLAMKFSGFSNGKGLCAGLMTVPQLSATLAAAAIGKDLGMLSDDFFNAIVVLSIVTTLPIPNLVRWVIEKFKLDFSDVGHITPYKLPENTEQDELHW
ncbi:MAG: cation:proton antiporter [Lentisphaerae bacterium]|nr:cation:proton antiporter [Lentisphaerota bacterium]